ncbi:MAG: LCP family protein [Actinomycetota bacterium]|nr:LCP family protein [Actinomycetota bacterium]MDA8209430.1 LCP family protein [Actinomycetota bacterium]
MSRPVRITLKVLAVLIAVAVLAIGGFALYGQILLDRVHRVVIKSEVPQQSGQPINILLIGNNTRTGLNPAEAKSFGSASQVGGGRADVSMIAHFDPKTKQVTLLSIPRDLFMPIPGTKQLQRVDAALNPTSKTGGQENPDQLVRTIEYDLGIPIQHYVELNFDTFQGVVNALGGIRMYFPMPVRDKESGLNVTTPGCRTLNGFQALQVVRARHLDYQTPQGVWVRDPLGDLSRTRRDHIFLKVLAEQVKAKGLSNPVQDLKLLQNVYPYLTLDSAFSESELLSLVLTYRHADPATAPTGTLPIAFEGGNTGYVYNGANYGAIVFPQEPADTQMIAQLAGLATPSIAPSSIRVAVVNGSHSAALATQTTQGLQALGYQATQAGSVAPTANPAESIIYYTPGNITKAEALKASLGGSVIMGQVPSTGYGAPIELLVGDQLAVAIKVQAASAVTTTTGVPAPGTTAAEKPSTSTTAAQAAKSASPSVTIPDVTAPTQVNTNQSPEPWDPRACPA